MTKEKIYKVSIGDPEFFDSFYWGTHLDEVPVIALAELQRLHSEWGAEEPFEDWLEAHFVEA